MIIGIASEKGGVGKSTTAIHLAGFLSRSGTTLLLDGDRTRIATNWAARGKANKLPASFDVAPIEAAAMLAGRFEHKVIDTGQEPGEKDLLALAQYSDLLIVPTPPAAFNTDGLGQTIRALRMITRADGSPVNFKVLFTKVSHHHHAEISELRQQLDNGRVPMFAIEIPNLKVFEKAADRGVLVDQVADDPRSAEAWAAYEAVGKELADGSR